MLDIPEDVLNKSAAGDLQSFEVIYKEAAGFVYNVALRMVNNKEDAEEVTQEVFLLIYRKLKNFRFESSFKTWVYRVTVNCALNFVKKRSRGRDKNVPYDEQLSAGAEFLFAGRPGGSAQKELDRRDQAQLIERLLGRIHPDQRACVVLRDLEGLSYQQIAQLLQININTVRSRLKRAREKLLMMRKEVSHEHL